MRESLVLVLLLESAPGLPRKAGLDATWLSTDRALLVEGTPLILLSFFLRWLIRKEGS
jgi:hypothetical protein